jgi:hypothetical protein
LVVWGWLAGAAVADPLPGQVKKFEQLPMVATPIGGVLYYGHDELSTAVKSPTGAPLYSGVFMADDFADKVESDIVHIKWWGSYLQQQEFGVSEFLVAFESDVPAGPNNPFSRPGSVLSAQILTKGPLSPGSGTFTETLIRAPDPVLGEALYEYNGELKLPFHQLADTVYWLKIVALVDPARDGPLAWGWHNRDYTIFDPLASSPPAVVPGEFLDGTLPSGEPIWHFQDDAVTGGILLTIASDPPALIVEQSDFSPTFYISPPDGPSPIVEHSKDLAFALYYVPEPGTLALLAIGLAWVAADRIRRGR